MSETMGRCRSEVDDCYGGLPLVAIADAIDRLAEDVAAVKAKVDAVSPEDVAHLLESEKAWVALVTEQRDEATCKLAVARAEVVTAMEQRGIAVMQRDAAITRRDDAEAEVERLRAELAARPAANSPEIPDSSPADPPPAAPAAGWLTQEERRILSAHVQALRDQRRAMERGGQTLGYSANPCGLKREADAIDALLARAGSLPVVEVPVLGFLGDMTGREQGIVLAYRDALDKAGVAWKAVPRE